MGDDSGLIMDRALGFIDKHRKNPFLAVVWFHAPHLPCVASKEDVETELGKSSEWGLFAIAAGNGGPGGILDDDEYLTSVSGVAGALSSGAN